MIKRRLLSTTALVLPAAAALAGCAAIEKITGTTTPQGAVQAVFNSVQFVLPLIDALALGISVAVPGSAAIMAGVMTLINQAGPVFQTLDAAMTTATAQPIVKQIEGYVTAGTSAIAGVVNSTPALAAYKTRVAQAQAVVGLLTTFVNGVSPTAALAPTVLPPLLHR